MSIKELGVRRVDPDVNVVHVADIGRVVADDARRFSGPHLAIGLKGEFLLGVGARPAVAPSLFKPLARDHDLGVVKIAPADLLEKFIDRQDNEFDVFALLFDAAAGRLLRRPVDGNVVEVDAFGGASWRGVVIADVLGAAEISGDRIECQLIAGFLLYLPL
ncbi:MAG: hypothetical protein APF80_09565 [Alphaproteobacteria bacterium BRH_c36]|nr:MAG: hypothetical protein APF80_09565 [Alphaproteobacteria bacterium BRH_c36]